jgi:hypothetical protein
MNVSNARRNLVIVPTVLALMLLFCVPTSAFAEDTLDVQTLIENSDINDEFGAVEDTVSILENAGVDLTGIEETSDGTIVLDAEIGDVESKIEIIEASYDGLSLSITEDNKTDTLEFLDDGTVLLDGDELKVEITTTEKEVIDNDTLETNSKHRTTLTSTCPYGNATDYTTYAGRTVISTEWEREAVKYTISALVFAIGILIMPVTGTLVGLASSLASQFAPKIIDQVPKAKGMTVETYAYYHKTKGARVATGKKVTRELKYFYAGIGTGGKYLGSGGTLFHIVED